MSALFFLLDMGAGLVGGLGFTGTAEGFVAGFHDIAFSAILVGFMRAIFVVLEQGHIVDTIVQGLATPLAHLPIVLAALGMHDGRANGPAPARAQRERPGRAHHAAASAALRPHWTAPVLAFQYGALMAMFAATGARYDQWLRFARPLYGLLLALGAVSVLLGIWLNIG